MQIWCACQLLVDCVSGASDRGVVPEDRLHVAGRHYVGRVLHVHAARVRRDGGLVRTCPPGRLPAAGQVETDAAPRPHPPHPRHTA